VLNNKKHLTAAEKESSAACKMILKQNKWGSQTWLFAILLIPGEASSVCQWDLQEADRRPKSIQSTKREKRQRQDYFNSQSRMATRT
jgi:hypothetical protein